MSTCLWEALPRPDGAVAPHVSGAEAAVAWSSLSTASSLADPVESFRGLCIVLATRDQLGTALALVELDGVARRLVLCTPDLTADVRAWVAVAAQADAMLSDTAMPGAMELPLRRLSTTLRPLMHARRGGVATEWILLTSGTTGKPKLVVHTLASLAGELVPTPARALGSALGPTVWSTFYDIRRYGGLQIYLRALLGGWSLVLSSSAESAEDFLARAGAGGVTHISGTPSHWRRALMSGATAPLRPDYVRLSGEVADQAVLDALRAAFPRARIGHAFASTEAGVAFDVNDGRAGFPASILDSPRNGIEMKVEDGTLRIRSRRTATRYLGEAPPLTAQDGFVDTGDLVERVEDRYFFRGRRGGVINVGGLKVYPEEVEAVLNADPRVRMSRVHPRRNPITGALVVADIVLADGTPADAPMIEAITRELMSLCRKSLEAYKVPTKMRVVPALELTAAGKLVRPDA